MAARGRGLFSLYIYIEKLKILLVRNHWTDFHLVLQKCSFGDPLPRLFKPSGFVKKHGRQGEGLIFPIYLYRKLKQEAHGPRVAHLTDIATADMQILCNIFPILSSQLMKRSSFKQFFILKKIYGMPVN